MYSTRRYNTVCTKEYIYIYIYILGYALSPISLFSTRISLSLNFQAKLQFRNTLCMVYTGGNYLSGFCDSVSGRRPAMRPIYILGTVALYTLLMVNYRLFEMDPLTPNGPFLPPNGPPPPDLSAWWVSGQQMTSLNTYNA